ncbi:MAG: TraR/DksA family transcriptional regulator [Bacillaceae bacterium]
MKREMLDEIKKELLITKNELVQRLIKGYIDALNTEFALDFGLENTENVKNKYLLHTIQDDLNDVEIALQKINEGTYGICEETGEKIPINILQAIPTARTIYDLQYVWV